MSENIPAIKTNEDYKKEVLNKITNIKEEPKLNKTQNVSELDNKWKMNNKIIELFVKNIEKDQKLRSIYAIILVVILGLELMALITIFILAGCKVLTYTDATFNLFITGGIAEVFVLVRLIVKYLFKDNLTEALKIIITTNNNKKSYESKLLSIDEEKKIVHKGKD